ncbi:MAG: hypothetical protein WBR17_34300, partial [Paraburkholderia sp.]
MNALGWQQQRTRAFEWHAATFQVHDAPATTNENHLPVSGMRMRLGAPAATIGDMPDMHKPVLCFKVLNVQPDLGNRRPLRFQNRRGLI